MAGLKDSSCPIRADSMGRRCPGRGRWAAGSEPGGPARPIRGAAVCSSPAAGGRRGVDSVWFLGMARKLWSACGRLKNTPAARELRRRLAKLGLRLATPAGLIGRAEPASNLLEAAPKLLLEPPLGGLVEALGLQALREHRLVGDARRARREGRRSRRRARACEPPGSGRPAGMRAAASRRARECAPWPAGCRGRRRSTSAPAPGRRLPGRG